MANGRLPASTLARVPGSGPFGGPVLRKDAAGLYNALHAESMRRFGVSMELHEGEIGRAYRSFPRQEIAWRTLPRGQAARPGTSNHGLGMAVDLMNRKQRWVVDQIGRKYGFSKSWSDAQHEWWHIVCRPERATAKPLRPAPPVLKRGHRGASVRTLQRRLRALGFNSVPVKGPKHGYYGYSTKLAVQRFQRKHKLKSDGICGPVTWRAIERAVS